MKFYWNSMAHIDEDLHKFCVELEYKLRPRITRFLISHLERECNGDYSGFYFDVDLTSGQITISDKTPLKYRRKIASNFENEINLNFVQPLFDQKYPSSSSY